jgi:uncharacterized protein YeaO (DUF488 family)
MDRLVQMKRVYDPPSPRDGRRILIDRIWPRGLTKEAAELDDWIKDIAPSTSLRKWFNHRPDRWQEFRRRYLAELAEHSVELADLRARMKEGPVTLVFAAKDRDHSNANVLLECLAPGNAENIQEPVPGAISRKRKTKT